MRFAARQTGASHLPIGVTRLIGRRRELRELRDLLLRDDVKLVSLTGPKGIGKTRLAIEVSHEAVKAFEHTWFVALEGVMEPHRVPSAILHGVGMREEDARPPLSCLAEYLESRNGLLVLDNFEQVTDAAPLVAQLLTSCPQLKILVTSRELLHLRAEHEYIVQPLISVEGDADLDLPDAIALFLERAPAIKPTPDMVHFIGEICARLDGLPLAIELPAARSKLLSPQAMLGRLKDRFRWLGGVHATCRSGSRRCVTLSTGATIFSRPLKRPCCSVCPFSKVAQPLMQSKRCVPERVTHWTCSLPWPTRAY